MSVEATIEKKVKTAFRTENVFVQNESHLHSGPATESHFNLTIVSDYFRTLQELSVTKPYINCSLKNYRMEFMP